MGVNEDDLAKLREAVEWGQQNATEPEDQRAIKGAAAVLDMVTKNNK